MLDEYELEPPDVLCRRRSTGTYGEQLAGSDHREADVAPSTDEADSPATSIAATKSPRAAAAAAAAARGILSQTSRTPWLRTPDGVPVRIDWPVLAPRVLMALGIWLGVTALVMRTTNQSRR